MAEPDDPIPLCVPNLAGNEQHYLKAALDDNWVSSAGPYVDRFEEAVAEYTGASHAVATCNGTAALHTALRVAGVEEGDEVLLPTLTFVAPANAVKYLGAEPVFMDVRRETWQLDVDKTGEFLKEQCERVEGRVVNRSSGRRIAAILPVHLMGLAVDMEPLVELTHEWGITLLEDAAEAMGVRYRGSHAGTFGLAGCLSFNGNKIITAGGGGMILTEDEAFADRARYLTTQAKDDPLEYVHEEIGYNYRMTTLQARVGEAQLEQLDDFVERKREIAARYERAIAEMPGLEPMPAPTDVEPTYWLYTMLAAGDGSGPERRTFLGQLRDRGVLARPFWHPVHRLKPYRDNETWRIEAADDLHARGISLPCSTGMTEAEQTKVIETIRDLVY